ncbi:carboxypeptidase regulatory-like domain-containing protein [Sphingobacterium sp. UDSM-2020]|uniref:carboxypeptidase regulatory-like domain-containing protein n=1 Tax=Sphingobacterium sp. UDSM-2020 TaxID=2795738 RepID=UPI0019366461|nr:carboxypeptidase regulatory-like domain-containing protein [Sphingobacterium sp. UDSM-2020]QQD13388.1 carboxypeptidase regulatory-like domain-containing protein [Sphingobacterium sp. UDSM-2020]
MVKEAVLGFYLFLFISISANCQVKLKGTVIDSTYKRAIEYVTVSSFEEEKTLVNKITLTNNSGKFELDGLPINKRLLLKFSVVGYKPATVDLKLTSTVAYDLGNVLMVQSPNYIDTINIIPPITLKGDTIEFNADAFDLDSNAVVEDLLHKLPGIVVWGDKSITYNGIPIPNILVNGKQFFGNDLSIALQNIDKKAVNKLQLYDKRRFEEKIKDPEKKDLEINILLKEGRENMLFGNIGGGIGSKNRLQSQLNLNKANKIWQNTIAFSGNSVNITVNSLDQLLKNTTYKGIGVNSDFSPDFQRQGITKQMVLASRSQYDFNPDANQTNKNLITANFFSNWALKKIKDTNTTILLNNNYLDQNLKENSTLNVQDGASQLLDIVYTRQLNPPIIEQKKTKNYGFNLNVENSNNEVHNTQNTIYNYSGNKSQNNITSLFNTNNKSLGLYTYYHSYPLLSSISKREDKSAFINNLETNVSLNVKYLENRFDGINNGIYNNVDNPTLNQNQERLYDNFNSISNFVSNIGIRYKKWNLEQEFQFKEANWNDNVYDNSKKNSNLTHISELFQYKYSIKTKFNKDLILQKFPGRYSKNLFLNAALGYNVVSDNNRSSINYRNFYQSFSNFTPLLSLNYNKNKIDKVDYNLSLQYAYNQLYPNVNDYKPFYDDINIGYRNYGYQHQLRSSGTHQLVLAGSINSLKKYGSNLSVEVSFKIIDNPILDSIELLNNQYALYKIQTENNIKAFNSKLSFNIAFLLANNNTLTLKLFGNYERGNTFLYFNSDLQDMIQENYIINTDVFFTLINTLQVGFKSNLSLYRRIESKFGIMSNSYNSTFFNNAIAVAYNINKRIILNSNIDYRSNYFRKNNLTSTVWNASLSYRGLKTNNLEIKIAVFDLLKQNKGFYFIENPYEFTSGSRNVLTNYLMFSISYFPRKFGKH